MLQNRIKGIFYEKSFGVLKQQIFLDDAQHVLKMYEIWNSGNELNSSTISQVPLLQCTYQTARKYINIKNTSFRWLVL